MSAIMDWIAPYKWIAVGVVVLIVNGRIDAGWTYCPMTTGAPFRVGIFGLKQLFHLAAPLVAAFAA